MKKIISIFMACLLCFCTAVPAFAAENIETSNDETTQAVTTNNVPNEDPGIAPMAYYEFGTISFRNKYSTDKKWFDGGRMAIEISCRSNTPGLKIQAIIHIEGYKALMHDVPVDGALYKWDWIPLGTNSGRNVHIEYVCNQNPNAVIEVSTKAYSW